MAYFTPIIPESSLLLESVAFILPCPDISTIGKQLKLPG